MEGMIFIICWRILYLYKRSFIFIREVVHIFSRASHVCLYVGSVSFADPCTTLATSQATLACCLAPFGVPLPTPHPCFVCFKHHNKYEKGLVQHCAHFQKPTPNLCLPPTQLRQCSCSPISCTKETRSVSMHSVTVLLTSFLVFDTALNS